YRRALAINEKTRGANHPETVRILNDLALLDTVRHDAAGALAHSRKATAGVLAYANLGDSRGPQSREGGGLIEQRASFFVNHVANLAGAERAGIESAPALGREAFEIAQWANQSAAAAAVQQLTPRFGARNDELAALVRQNQDLSAYWRDRDRALVEALSRPQAPSNAAQIDNIRRQIADTERKLTAVSAQLQKEFPDSAALSSPKPLTVVARP